MAAMSAPRLALAGDDLADRVLRELKTGLLSIIGECGGENVGFDSCRLSRPSDKTLRVVADKVLFWKGKRHKGRLGLYMQPPGSCWELVGNVQVFDFDEFRLLQRITGVSDPAGAGWKTLDTWLRDTRGLNLNRRAA